MVEQCPGLPVLATGEVAATVQVDEHRSGLAPVPEIVDVEPLVEVPTVGDTAQPGHAPGTDRDRCHQRTQPATHRVLHEPDPDPLEAAADRGLGGQATPGQLQVSRQREDDQHQQHQPRDAAQIPFGPRQHRGQDQAQRRKVRELVHHHRQHVGDLAEAPDPPQCQDRAQAHEADGDDQADGHAFLLYRCRDCWSSRTRRRRGGSAVGHVDEPGVVTLERDRDLAGGTVPVLGDDQVGLARIVPTRARRRPRDAAGPPCPHPARAIPTREGPTSSGACRSAARIRG